MKAIELLNNIKSTYVIVDNKGVDETLSQKQSELLSKINSKDLIEKVRDSYVNDFLYLPIHNILNDNEIQQLKNIVVDRVPIPKINASACKTDENEYLIIITDRLMGLLHTWNEIQVKIGITAELQNKDVSRLFAPIIDCYLTPNSNKTLPIFSLDELPVEYSILATKKTIMHEQFILAHELAHIYLGHFDKVVGTSSFLPDFFLSDFYENPENIEKEFEADIQAVKWLSRMDNSKKILSLYVEALVMLHYIECNTGFPSSKSSHPASLLRLYNIKEKCNEYFNGCEYTLDEMIYNCCDIASFEIAVQ